GAGGVVVGNPGADLPGLAVELRLALGVDAAGAGHDLGAAALHPGARGGAVGPAATAGRGADLLRGLRAGGADPGAERPAAGPARRRAGGAAAGAAVIPAAPSPTRAALLSCVSCPPDRVADARGRAAHAAAPP